MKVNKNDHYSRLESKNRLSLSEKYFLKIYRDVKNNLSFEEYIKKYHKIPYTDWMYSDSKKIDYIIKFENLQEDFSNIMIKLGYENNEMFRLPKKNVIEGKPNFLTFYTKSIQVDTQKIFGMYMRKFDYSFPHDWVTYKLSIWDKVKFHFVNTIMGVYYKYIF